MNEHLGPVFSEILPLIEQAGIKYWVYGGVAYASMVGKVYRGIKDVDIFVLENDFDNLEKILVNTCIMNKWSICKSYDIPNRPKIEIYIGGKERLSAIPVVKTNERVVFKFCEGPKNFSLDILNQVERLIDGFR
jgi:hypothetical protein